MAISGFDWLARLAAEFNTSPPSSEDIDELLAIAAIAAHTSERTAAPVSCWLASRAGLSPSEARVVAERLAADIDLDK